MMPQSRSIVSCYSEKDNESGGERLRASNDEEVALHLSSSYYLACCASVRPVPYDSVSLWESQLDHSVFLEDSDR